MRDALVGVVDYGAGNTGSVISALRYLGVEARVVGKPEELKKLDKLILPGVGSYKRAMENLKANGLISVLRDEVTNKQKPLLGICLGFQMLFSSSTEEGFTDGLGLLNGNVSHLKEFIGENLKLPHIGFNQIDIYGSHPFFRGVSNGTDFYFVHSYGLDIKETHLESFSSTEYGEHFVSGVAQANIMGTQFHPEKSQSNGLILLKNFLDY